MANNSVINIIVSATDNVTPKVKSIESTIIRTVGAITAAFASIKAVIFPVKEASDFEKEMKNVQKTTNFTDGEIKLLSSSLLEMARVLGISETELAKVSAIAGQLGLGDQGRQAVEAFTKSVARASVTLDITAEDAANAGAQIASIFKLDLSQTERVFATINELSNNSVATASDLVDIIKRVGSTSKATFTEVAALAAVFREVGIPNEQAGTAIVKFLSGTAAEAKKFAKVMGVSTKEWLTLVETSAVDALKRVAVKIAQLPTGIQEATIKELQGSGRLFSAGTKFMDDAANGFAITTKMSNIANQAFIDGTSSIKEYSVIMDSLSKQTDVAVDSFRALMVEAGNQSLPVLTQAMKDLSSTLGDPKIIAFAVDLGKGIADIISGFIALVKEVRSWEIEWKNVIAAIKLFLEYKLVQVLFGIGSTALKSALGLQVLWGWLVKVATVLKGLSAGGATAAAAGTALAIVPQLKQASSYASMLQAQFAAASVAGGRLAATVSTIGLALRSALLSPIGLVITALAVLGVAVATQKQKIMEFFGFVDSNLEKIRRSKEQAEREYQKSLDDATSKFNTAMKLAEKITPASGNIPVQSGANLAKTALADGGLVAYREELLRVTKEINTVSDGLAGLAKQQENANRTVTDGIKGYSDTSKKIREAEKEIQRLKSASLDFGLGKAVGDIVKTPDLTAIANDIKNGEVAKAWSDIFVKTRPDIKAAFDDLAKGVGSEEARNTAIAKQREIIAALTDQQNVYAISVEKAKEANKDTEKGVVKLTGAYVQLQSQLSSFNDPSVIAFVKKQAEIKKVADSITQYEETLKSAAKAQKIFQDSGRPISEQPVTTSRIPEIDSRLQELSKQREALQKESDRLESTFVDKKLAESIKSLDTAQVTGLAEAFTKVSKEGQRTNTIVGQMKLNLPDALIGYIRTKKLADALKKGNESAEAFRKTAESVFNNTNTEISALIDSVKNFRSALVKSFADIKIKLQVDNADKAVDRQLESIKKAIDKRYDRELQVATNTEKQKIERAKRIDAAFYGGELPTEVAARYDAEIAKIDQVIEANRKKAQAQADADAANAKTANQATAAQIKYERSLQSVANLMEQAKQAAAQGNISDALVLKDQAKKSINTAMDLVNELQGLTNVDALGNLSFSVDEATIRKLSDEVTQTGSKLSEDIQSANTVLFDTAKNVATEWKNANDSTQARLKEQSDILNEYRAVFRDFDKLAATAEIAFDNIIASSASASTNVFNSISGAVNAIGSANPTQLFDEFSRAATNAVEVVGKGITPTNAIESFDESIKNAAPKIQETFSRIMSDANLQVSQDMAGNLQQLLGQRAKEAADAVKNNPVELVGGFNAEQIQSALSKIPTPTIDIKGNILVAGADTSKIQANARGGYVQGPGTGTSDSILSWLSNREYVIDAHTTGVFGAPFFRTLQMLARSGRSIPKLKRGFPAFAGGGLVGIEQMAQKVSGNTSAIINIPGIGSFPVEAKPDVLADLSRATYKASLKQGRNRRTV